MPNRSPIPEYSTRAANMVSPYVALDSWDSASSPGLYLPKLDVRAEDFFTPPRAIFPGFYYFNVGYPSGYTNNRQLVGSWIGREGSGLDLWGTWWFSPRVSLQGNYRAMSANPQFLRAGDLHDATLVSDLRLGREWLVHLSDQFGRWRFPLLLPNASGDMMASAQLTWSPAPGRP